MQDTMYSAVLCAVTQLLLCSKSHCSKHKYPSSGLQLALAICMHFCRVLCGHQTELKRRTVLTSSAVSWCAKRSSINARKAQSSKAEGREVKMVEDLVKAEALCRCAILRCLGRLCWPGCFQETVYEFCTLCMTCYLYQWCRSGWTSNFFLWWLMMMMIIWTPTSLCICILAVLGCLLDCQCCLLRLLLCPCPISCLEQLPPAVQQLWLRTVCRKCRVRLSLRCKLDCSKPYMSKQA